MSRADEMAELVTRWEASGLSQRAFAEQEGVAYSAFQYWRRRLRREATVQLAPVRIVPDGPPAVSAAPAFELQTRSGLTLSVPAGFDEPELRRLLTVLSTC